ncbi:Cytochrome c oxidase subunit 7C, mitochondrial [Eufriesea mexicana]|uniref:Cytochrome c oxidase subunit 7C, mitochondrial n=1 Tax=Eufriesea mexicana TaxID=516756 RepID=A0A310SKI5_9HYME|nr:PREDICTED: cytochrome c oxidase subunit 7C, mitochondrial [Eufriesea mexicana]OAD54227.1 Cytochrome c oxidase subunit 7C, mitochondrial [Eufriesea mexicana]
MLNLKMVSRQFTRLFRTSSIRPSHEPEGFPGANLPLDIQNRYKLTAIFILFFGSGLAIPFLLVRYHLKKEV